MACLFGVDKLHNYSLLTLLLDEKIFFLFIAFLLSGCFITAYSGDNNLAQDSDSDQDSLVNVIGWFVNHDTVDYWIEQTRGRLTPDDTVKTAQTSAKVRLTVVDSTATGYKLDYTFLDFRVEHIEGSKLSSFQERVAEKLGKALIGTTVQFETDEFGVITNITNFEQLKHKVKSIYKIIFDEIKNSPEGKEMANAGINVDNMLNSIDENRMVEDLISELRLLFIWHGNAFAIGKGSEHEEASDTTYASDTYTIVSIDPDEGIYTVDNEVVSVIPVQEVIDFVYKQFGPSDVDVSKLMKVVEGMGVEDGIFSSALAIEYFFDGWPANAVKQEKMTIAGYGQVKQTYIYMTYCASREQ